MRWAKVSIKSRKSEADVVATLFDDIGAGGVEIVDPTLSPADWAIVDWAVPPEGKQGVAEDDPVVTVTSYLADDAELAGRIEKLKDELVKFAKRSGTAYKADDVLPQGIQVFLRRNSNISTGGDSVDVTETMHTSYKELAAEMATAMGAWVCGVDLIIPDSTLPASKNNPNCTCIELNFNPSMYMHTYCAEGSGQSITPKILAKLFPEMD